MITGNHTVAVVLLGTMSVSLVSIGGCAKTAHPFPHPAGAGTPRALLDRMYASVEHDDLAEFDACHSMEGLQKELIDSIFEYLVVQSQLRKAVVNAYGEDVASTFEQVRDGLILFDTSWFPEATIEQEGDSATAKGPTVRVSDRETQTPSVGLMRINGRWFLVDDPEGFVFKDDWYKGNTLFTRKATLLLQQVLLEVKAGTLPADELDARIERDLLSLY